MITEKPGTEASNHGEASDFDLSIEERGLDDIRALGCNSLEDEREFAAVARAFQSSTTPSIRPSSSLGLR